MKKLDRPKLVIRGDRISIIRQKSVADGKLSFFRFKTDALHCFWGYIWDQKSDKEIKFVIR